MPPSPPKKSTKCSKRREGVGGPGVKGALNYVKENCRIGREGHPLVSFKQGFTRLSSFGASTFFQNTFLSSGRLESADASCKKTRECKWPLI